MRYQSDNLLQLVAPTDVKAGAVISTGTCTGRLYDDAKDAALSSDALALATELSVAGAVRFVPGVDLVAVELDDGSIHEGGLVVSVNGPAGTIEITTGLASPAAAGSRVMVKLGADLTFAAYGTPVLGADDWGFDATVQSTHAGLRPGIKVRAEIILDAAGVVTLEAVRSRVTVGA